MRTIDEKSALQKHRRKKLSKTSRQNARTCKPPKHAWVGSETEQRERKHISTRDEILTHTNGRREAWKGWGRDTTQGGKVSIQK